MSTREFAERAPGPPERHHCCECDHCITEAEAGALLAPLEWLNRPYPEPQPNAVLAPFRTRAAPPATMLERIGAVIDALERNEQSLLAARLNAVWLELEALDGILREVAKEVLVCAPPGSCAEHGRTDVP